MRGHIRKRAKNTWTIVVDYGRDSLTGKRQQQWITIPGTKRDAEKKLSDLLYQLDRGSFVKSTKLTLGDFFQQWMRDYVTTNVRAATAEGYKIIIECHLVPALGAIILSQLSPSHLQKYYAHALKEGRRDGGGLSARTPPAPRACRG